MYIHHVILKIELWSHKKTPLLPGISYFIKGYQSESPASHAHNYDPTVAGFLYRLFSKEVTETLQW